MSALPASPLTREAPSNVSVATNCSDLSTDDVAFESARACSHGSIWARQTPSSRSKRAQTLHRGMSWGCDEELGARLVPEGGKRASQKDEGEQGSGEELGLQHEWICRRRRMGRWRRQRLWLWLVVVVVIVVVVGGSCGCGGGGSGGGCTWLMMINRVGDKRLAA